MDTLAFIRFFLLAAAPTSLFAASVPLPPDRPAISILVPDESGRWFSEQVDSDDPFAVSEWRVTPNPRDLALRPALVSVPLPDGRVLAFETQRLDYVSGVDLDEHDNLIIDPDPRNLSFYWSGVGPEGTASVSVHRGTFRAQVIGFRDRIQVAQDRFGRDTYSVLDTDKLNQVQCLSSDA